MLSRFKEQLKPQPHKWRVRHPRVWIGIAVAALVVFGGAAAYKTIFSQPANPQPGPVPAQSLAPQPLTPSNYQQTRQAFGPWHLASPGSTGAPHLVMLLTGGGVDVSSKVARPAKAWQPATETEIIAAKAVRNGVIVGYGSGLLFILKLQYRQAFVMEDRPDVVYSYLNDGPDRAVLVSTTVKALIGR